MGFILKERDFSYYRGPSEKYSDMITFSASAEFAKAYETRDDAMKVSNNLERAGYDFEILFVPPKDMTP